MANDFSGKVRRVVTGHDANGRSMVVSDGDAPHVRTNPLRPGHLSTDLWRIAESPARIVAQPAETTDGPRRIMPAPNGAVFRISVIPPETKEVLRLGVDEARKLFADMGAP